MATTPRRKDRKRPENGYCVSHQTDKRVTTSPDKFFKKAMERPDIRAIMEKLGSR